MSLQHNFTSPSLYSTKLKQGDEVKNGIIFFCGKPASWMAYILYSRQKLQLPDIETVRKNTKKICRSPDSFRPNPFIKLKKTSVYHGKFVFNSKKKLKYICVFDSKGNHIETYFYSPLI